MTWFPNVSKPKTDAEYFFKRAIELDCFKDFGEFVRVDIEGTLTSEKFVSIGDFVRVHNLRLTMVVCDLDDHTSFDICQDHPDESNYKVKDAYRLIDQLEFR